MELHEKTYEEFLEDSIAIQKRDLINKAWKWINNKVELSYTDYDDFLKTMEE